MHPIIFENYLLCQLVFTHIAIKCFFFWLYIWSGSIVICPYSNERLWLSPWILCSNIRACIHLLVCMHIYMVCVLVRAVYRFFYIVLWRKMCHAKSSAKRRWSVFLFFKDKCCHPALRCGNVSTHDMQRQSIWRMRFNKKNSNSKIHIWF